MSFDFKISAIRTAAVQGDINWQHKKAQAVAADPQKAEPSPVEAAA